MCLNCHVVSVEVHIKDIDAFKAACNKLGWTFNQGQPHQWYGSWVDDSPVPRHLFQSDEEQQAVQSMPKNERIKFMNALMRTAAHSVTVPGHEYQIGLIRSGDHYRLAWDTWEERHWSKDRQLDMKPLLHDYAVNATLNAASQNGHTHTLINHADGTTHIRIQVGA